MLTDFCFFDREGWWRVGFIAGTDGGNVGGPSGECWIFHAIDRLGVLGAGIGIGRVGGCRSCCRVHHCKHWRIDRGDAGVDGTKRANDF
jgi:hypothetical protein